MPSAVAWFAVVEALIGHQVVSDVGTIVDVALACATGAVESQRHPPTRARAAAAHLSSDVSGDMGSGFARRGFHRSVNRPLGRWRPRTPWPSLAATVADGPPSSAADTALFPIVNHVRRTTFMLAPQGYLAARPHHELDVDKHAGLVMRGPRTVRIRA